MICHVQPQKQQWNAVSITIKIPSINLLYNNVYDEQGDMLTFNIEIETRQILD